MEEKRRVKPIVLRDKEDGTEYTLEFTRNSVKFAESRGFKIDSIGNAPMSAVEELFFYSFRANHPTVKREKIMKILYEDIVIPEGFVERLIDLYTAPFDVFSEEKDDEEIKNARMTVEL